MHFLAKFPVLHGPCAHDVEVSKSTLTNNKTTPQAYLKKKTPQRQVTRRSTHVTRLYTSSLGIFTYTILSFLPKLFYSKPFWFIAIEFPILHLVAFDNRKVKNFGLCFVFMSTIYFLGFSSTLCKPEDSIFIYSMNKNHEYERVFNHFDENGDGKISPAELQQCVKAVGGELSLVEAEVAVEALDSDGDGMLGLEDFVRLVEEVEEEEKVKDLKEAFKMYEMEGCGCITPKSLKRMLSRLGESRSLEDCKLMIARFDLNGDGVLHFDEFRVMML